MFIATVKCKCDYEFNAGVQFDEKLTIYAAQKVMQEHQLTCQMGCQITFSNDER